MNKIILITFILLLSISLNAQTAKEDSGFKKAEKFYFQKKFEMAEMLLQEEIKKNPENDLAYSYLGDIFLNKKRYDGALSLYQKALELKPENADNYFRIGQSYYYKRLGNPAIENYQKAIELDKSLKIAYYQVGLTYLMILRDKENTIKNWETFIRLSPEDPQYSSIQRVIQLLKDPNFIIPPPGSDISIEEALLLGGAALKKIDRQADDKQAGQETKKTNQKIEDVYTDDDL
jgi:tetratricopeptide (TPR) repeat protein